MDVARGADGPPPSPGVLLMFDGSGVRSLDLGRPGAKPVPVIERAGWFRCHPSGHFIMADKDIVEFKRGVRWYVGHVSDPKAAREVTCPLRDGGEFIEVIKEAVLSNDASRVLWATFRPKQDGRLLVTRVADGATTVVLERPALGRYRTFGPPAWSPDDKRIAVAYLESSHVRPDPDCLVSLIEVDVSGEKPKDRLIVPNPFSCNESESAAPIWLPDGKRLIISKAEAGWERGGYDQLFIVGIDGGDMKPAGNIEFLDDRRHTVTDLKSALLPGGEWISQTGRLVDTTTGKSTPLKFESPVKAAVRKWSPDGRFLLVGLRAPAAAVRLVLIDTATGEKRTLMDNDNGIADERHLTFLTAPAAR
jgi:hypothetical protein